MDFSPAIDYHVLRLLILRGTSHDALDWGTYILAFHWLVWLSVIGLWVAMSVGLVFVAQPDAEITIQNYLFIFLGALAQQGSEVIPSCTRGRVVFYMYWIGSLLLYTSYTARLTSQLAVVNTNTPFDSLRDAMTKAHYKIATLKGTSYVSELQATTDPALAMAYAQMEEDPRLFVATMEAGVELAGTERVAFFQDVNSVSYITHGNCSFQWLGPEYFPSYVHLGYRKNLSYANALTYYVTMTATTGIIPKLMKKWWGATSTCSATTPFQNLSFSKTVSAFALLAVGLGAGLSLLMIEVLLNCVYRAFQKRKKVNRWMQHRKTFYY
ncbi:glutamate receptor 3-like [Oratosquilla oratoria]|uniref:glutamate receptor 3-like n=2 Tax=Oratosquilla oratoria TaxID=337810 RepID=UPI003F77109B